MGEAASRIAPLIAEIMFRNFIRLPFTRTAKFAQKSRDSNDWVKFSGKIADQWRRTPLRS